MNDLRHVYIYIMLILNCRPIYRCKNLNLLIKKKENHHDLEDVFNKGKLLGSGAFGEVK